MKNSILLILFMCFFNVIIAQNIKGLVVDEDNNPLEFASIALLQQKDSLLIKYTTTGADGRFELSEFKENTYLFQVYLMTYQANQRVLKVTNLPINLGIIKLDKEVNNLNEVVVSAIVPIKIKQDTIAFNAKAFKVKQDDNVEDLIKKLPGVQIGTDGSVTAQGQEITKILVDGKEFFGSDIKVATKNLPANSVAKVQVYDKKHLFSLAGEDEVFTAGSTKLIIEYRGWKICPLICYDLRFPVWARNTEAYDLLLYVANWPAKRSFAWQSLLVARAIENQSFVVGVNRVGEDGNQNKPDFSNVSGFLIKYILLKN